MNKQIKKYIWNKKMNLKNKIISKNWIKTWRERADTAAIRHTTAIKALMLTVGSVVATRRGRGPYIPSVVIVVAFRNRGLIRNGFKAAFKNGFQNC